jgi:hypothetical protein
MRQAMKTGHTKTGHTWGRAFALAGAVVGSGLWSGPVRADDPNIAGPNSFVRVMHAVAGGPKVDIFIDGQKKLNDVEFSAVTKYLRLPSGYHTFRITTNNPTRTMFSRGITLRNGDFYTLGAYGTWTRPRLLTFNDSAGSVAYSTARFTFFNLSPGSPPLDGYATNANGRVYRLFRRLRYGQTRAVYIPAVPMTFTFKVNGRTVKTVPGEEPRAGRKYAAYIIGRYGQSFRVQTDVTASQ